MKGSINKYDYENVISILQSCYMVIWEEASGMMRDVGECIENLNNDRNALHYQSNLDTACYAYRAICDKILVIINAMKLELQMAEEAAGRI